MPSGEPTAAAAGATGLDKKAKQRFEAQALAKLGAKAAKGPRIPASIGLGEPPPPSAAAPSLFSPGSRGSGGTPGGAPAVIW
jgi:hypothetical protein